MNESHYMLKVNTIRSLTQVECGQIASTAPSARQVPIWVLVCKTEEARAEIVASVTANFLTLESLNQWMEDGLLHILHVSRLHRYDAGRSKRLRHGDDLYGYLLTRIKDLDVIIAVVIPPVWDSKLPEGE